MKPNRILAILMTLVFPMAASAENVVVPLPTAAPQVETHVTQSDEYAIDLEGYYWDNGNVQQSGSFGEYQYPKLSDTEKARVPDMLKRYETGERPKQNVLDKTVDVVVAVYSIPPQDYNGETVYVLLPNRELTDEELLEVIDGYAHLGLTFDANGLSWRNCMRGGGIESARGNAVDESERYRTLTDLCRRQGLQPENPYTPSPSDDGFGEVKLNEDAYNGLDCYGFRPARRLTDDELLAYAAYQLGDDVFSANDYSANEQLARQQLHDLMGAPLSLTRTDESLLNANQMDMYNEDLEVYNGQFISSDSDGEGSSYSALISLADGTLYSAYRFSLNNPTYCDLHLDPFSEHWKDLTRSYIADIRSDDMPVISVESRGEVHLDDSYGVLMVATMQDGSSYELKIFFSTEAVCYVDYRAKAVPQEQVNAFYAENSNR